MGLQRRFDPPVALNTTAIGMRRSTSTKRVEIRRGGTRRDEKRLWRACKTCEAGEAWRSKNFPPLGGEVSKIILVASWIRTRAIPEAGEAVATHKP